jgi:hypothetical protein
MAKKRGRLKIQPSVETLILTSSARRCALCFLLQLDLSQKKGQIAHLDQNRENSAVEKLAYLCLEHHSEYDSTTSQDKNYTIHEVKEARERLYQAIKAGLHNPSPRLLPARTKPAETDRETLKDFLKILPSESGIHFLREFNFAGWSFDWESLQDIRRFYYSRSGPEHEFIDATLESFRKDLRKAIAGLLKALGQHTYVTQGSRSSVPEEWEFEQPERFNRAVSEIHDAAEGVCKAYDALVRNARGKLLT